MGSNIATRALNKLNKVASYRPEPIEYMIGATVVAMGGMLAVTALTDSGKRECQSEFNTAVSANPEWRARYSGFNARTPEVGYALLAGCGVTIETTQNHGGTSTKVEQAIKWDKGSNTLVLPQPLPANQ